MLTGIGFAVEALRHRFRFSVRICRPFLSVCQHAATGNYGSSKKKEGDTTR